MMCDCPECRALAEDLRANAEALSALRNEELPGSISRYPWVAAAIAAALLATVAVAPKPKAPAAEPVKSEPQKIKMLTPDPDVVIYWLIDSKKEGK